MRVRRVTILMAFYCAREEHVLQRGGAQDATVEVGQDGGQVGGAEAGRDGWECWGIGAVPDGGVEMQAVAEQDADGTERDREVYSDMVLPG